MRGVYKSLAFGELRRGLEAAKLGASSSCSPLMAMRRMVPRCLSTLWSRPPYCRGRGSSIAFEQNRLWKLFGASHPALTYSLPHERRCIFDSAIKPESLKTQKAALKEKLQLLTVDRIRLEGLMNPQSSRDDDMKRMISIREAKKLLRASQLQSVKERLRSIQKCSISYSEFIEICSDCLSGLRSDDEILRMAKILDESSVVIVLGSVVFLRPDQVIQAIQKSVPLPVRLPSYQRRELENMEREKHDIDLRAEALARRELWAGLAFLVIQTAGFMRLTFWELSWDVMEPICFFVTSIYFMVGYAFFLRTSKDPSFEGFFQNRFTAKQKKLMKAKKFDIEKLNALRRAAGLPEFLISIH